MPQSARLSAGGGGCNRYLGNAQIEVTLFKEVLPLRCWVEHVDQNQAERDEKNYPGRDNVLREEEFEKAQTGSERMSWCYEVVELTWPEGKHTTGPDTQKHSHN